MQYFFLSQVPHVKPHEQYKKDGNHLHKKIVVFFFVNERPMKTQLYQLIMAHYAFFVQKKFWVEINKFLEIICGHNTQEHTSHSTIY